jgi:cation transport protein ChaC
MSTMYAPLHLRDPQPMLASTMQAWGGQQDLWVFGYASLIWRPEFDADEQQPAVVHGWHRALEMRSRVNRGTPECPGLVFALVRGGSCRGMAYRIEQPRAAAELERLWVREMPTGVYDPKWLACRTPNGTVRALAFTLSRSSPAHTGALPDTHMLEVLRCAAGRFGSTLDYLLETATSLRGCGIRDRDVERLVALARQHDLIAAAGAATSVAPAPTR